MKIVSLLTISLLLVYFGYPVLATVGFISGLFYAISRRQGEWFMEGRNG